MLVGYLQHFKARDQKIKVGLGTQSNECNNVNLP